MPNITTTPIEVEAEVKQYTLVGDDIYVKRYDIDNIPDWYKDLINNILNNNGTITNITNVYNYLNSLQDGYNLSITHLQDGQLVINTRLESLKSSNDVALAGIADLWITKVDGASAQAIADTTIGAFFTGGNATSGAWFNERISTYASAIQVNASNITVLAAVLGANAAEIERIDSVVVTLEGSLASATQLLTAQFEGLEVQLESMDQAYAGMFHQWDGVEDVAIGMFKLIGDIQYQYLGGTLGENSDGWVRTDASASADADQALTWAAGASKLITAPDGTVTGWSFGDGSGVQSEFKINADNFIIQGATGAVDYDNALIVLPKTYEQTNPPSSGMLIGDTWIDTNDSYKSYVYTSSGWKANPTSKIFNQASQPSSGMALNDIWYDTDDGNKPYYYNGSSWSSIRDGTIATAQATADNALSVANTKTTLSAVQELGYVVPSGVANAINTNSTTISGSKITTGSIEALQISAGAITAAKLDVAALDGKSAMFSGSRGYNSDGYWAVTAGNPSYSGGGIHGQGYNYGVGAVATGPSGTAVHGWGKGTNSIGVKGTGTTYGVSGHGGRIGVYAEGTEWGFYTPKDANIGGTTYTFTGAHIAYGQGEYVVGDVVEIIDSWVVNVNQSYVQVRQNTTPYNKKIYGVVSAVTDDIHEYLKLTELVDTLEPLKYKDEYTPYIDALVAGGYKQIGVNALGEGAINACSEGGNIEIGDYLCSATTQGKVMKQNDDILHNYTVAKSLEAIDWSMQLSNEKLIACTYHSA